MSDDLGDFYRAMREDKKRHHAKMLAAANTDGWTRHTEYHYSRIFNGKRVDWWPGSGKAMIDGKMVYGHRKVKTMIQRLEG